MPQSPIVIIMDVLYYSLSVMYAPKPCSNFFLPLRSQDAEEKTLAWISKFTAKFDEASGLVDPSRNNSNSTRVV